MSKQQLTPAATRALCRELCQLSSEPCEDIAVSYSDENICEVFADITGPSGTPYEGASLFSLELQEPAMQGVGTMAAAAAVPKSTGSVKASCHSRTRFSRAECVACAHEHSVWQPAPHRPAVQLVRGCQHLSRHACAVHGNAQ